MPVFMLSLSDRRVSGASMDRRRPGKYKSEHYEAARCAVCSRVHFVNPKTEHLPGETNDHIKLRGDTGTGAAP